MILLSRLRDCVGLQVRQSQPQIAAPGLSFLEIFTILGHHNYKPLEVTEHIMEPSASVPVSDSTTAVRGD